MQNDEHNPKPADRKQANFGIATICITGLTVCFVAALYYQKDVPLILYAIFGGGILGTDNILKLLKSVFRIGDNGK